MKEVSLLSGNLLKGGIVMGRSSGGSGSSTFVLFLVLFILLVIVGASVRTSN